MTAPTPLRDPNADVVKAGAFRLTWISGAIASIGVIVTAFNDNVTKIFGENVSNGVKASVLIAIIAAWAVIAVADLLARAIVTSARLRRAEPEAVATPAGMKVKLTDGVDSKAWFVAAVRRDNESTNGDVQFLVVKSGEAPKWINQSGVAVEDPPKASS